MTNRPILIDADRGGGGLTRPPHKCRGVLMAPAAARVPSGTRMVSHVPCSRDIGSATDGGGAKGGSVEWGGRRILATTPEIAALCCRAPRPTSVALKAPAENCSSSLWGGGDAEKHQAGQIRKQSVTTATAATTGFHSPVADAVKVDRTRLHCALA